MLDCLLWLAKAVRRTFNLVLRHLIAFVRAQPNLVYLWHKGRNLRAITGDCRLVAPINFIRGISAARNWTPLDSFSFPLVSFSCRYHARRITHRLESLWIRRTRIHKQWFLLVLLSKSFSSHYLLVPPQTCLLASVQQPRAQILVLVVCFPQYQCLPTDHYCYYCYSKGLVVGLFSLKEEWACENFEFHCISGFLENIWGTYSLHGKTVCAIPLKPQKIIMGCDLQRCIF